jgi:hypothetical protein
MVPGSMVRMIVSAHGDNEFGFHARARPAMLEPGLPASADAANTQPAAAPEPASAVVAAKDAPKT